MAGQLKGHSSSIIACAKNEKNVTTGFLSRYYLSPEIYKCLTLKQKQAVLVDGRVWEVSNFSLFNTPDWWSITSYVQWPDHFTEHASWLMHINLHSYPPRWGWSPGPYHSTVHRIGWPRVSCFQMRPREFCVCVVRGSACLHSSRLQMRSFVFPSVHVRCYASKKFELMSLTQNLDFLTLWKTVRSWQILSSATMTLSDVVDMNYRQSFLPLTQCFLFEINYLRWSSIGLIQSFKHIVGIGGECENRP